MLDKDSKGFKPSATFKFLCDGADSDNITAIMLSFKSSINWNFLKEPMLTRVKHFEEETYDALIIEKKLFKG